MARLKIKYTAIDPYYSDQEQVFIGSDIEDCWSQAYMFEKYLGRNHSNTIMLTYKTEIIEEKL